MNFQQLVNAVGDDLNRTNLTAQCSDAVVMAIRHYDHRPWWFQDGSRSFTLTATTSVYPLPSTFRKMDYLEVAITSGNWQEIVETDYDTVKHMLEGNAPTGQPSKYVVRNTDLIVAHQPASEYHARMYFTQSLVDHTASASSSWTTDAKDLIRASAAKTVAARTMHDIELAQLMAEIEQSEFVRLVNENEKRTTTNKVKPC